MHTLLQKLAEATTAYLNAQIEAGAQAVMVFDTWGGVLTTPAYREFSLAYMQQIVSGLHREWGGCPVPVTLFTKGGGQWLEDIANTGCNAVGLDWSLDIDKARERVGNQVALQGNLDPCLLYADVDRIRAGARDIIDRFGNHPGHVFNLGHGIHPSVNPEHLGVLIDSVHEFGLAVREQS